MSDEKRCEHGYPAGGLCQLCDGLRRAVDAGFISANNGPRIVDAAMSDEKTSPVGFVLPGGYRLDMPLTATEESASFRRSIELLTREYFAFISANRERYVTAWVAETGLAPSESMLVEQRHADGRVTITVVRREGPEADARAMLDLLARIGRDLDLIGSHGEHLKSILAMIDKHGGST